MSKKKIGLALSGGGARGFAHIGVIKVLREHGIEIDMVAGSSAGSIVGAAFAAGMSPNELIEMADQVRWTNMTRPSMSPLGLLSSVPMGNFIRKHFPVTDFESLPIPFTALCCDFSTGRDVMLRDSGDLSFAVRASCAVPGVFVPMADSTGRVLVDGGVVAPLPIDAVREMGADIVIAVDLLACGAAFRSTPRTAVGMLLQSTMSLLRAASRNQQTDAEIHIKPALSHLRPDEIRKQHEIISLGERAAREMVDEIQSIIR